LLAIGSCFFAAVSARAFVGPALIGKIDPDYYNLWDDISRNTEYRDVVFSPVLQAAPIGAEVGVANKLVYPAKNFADIEHKTARICGMFNVVVALPPGVAIGEFMSREPTKVIETKNIRLLRFADYPGKKIGCGRQ
jgi:hypothetical protein